MNKNIPEKCCANCKYLLCYPKNNSYGDVEYLCVKLGRYIPGIYKDIEKADFFQIGCDKPDRKAKEICDFVIRTQNST